MSTPEVLERRFPGRRAQLKRDILAASLRCFAEHGIESATIDVIKAACDTSVGAIYHHFGNKDGLVAALFFCALEDEHALQQQRLDAATTAQAGVHAMVTAYVDWVTAEPDLARFLFQARAVVAQGPHAQALAEINKARGRALKAWFAQVPDAATLLRCPPDLLPSLVVGPAESHSRAWLGGRVRTSPARYRDALALAAWAAVQAVGAAP